jgi:hypothetical protein
MSKVIFQKEIHVEKEYITPGIGRPVATGRDHAGRNYCQCILFCLVAEYSGFNVTPAICKQTYTMIGPPVRWFIPS